MQSNPLLANDSTSLLTITSGNPGAEQLTEADRNEVLRFLHRRPIHCAYLLGLILDNGLVSPLNRGTFYAYRNYLGKIQGVALLGHAIIIETASDEALKAFARAALMCKKAHLIMREDRADRFWGYYSTDERGTSLVELYDANSQANDETLGFEKQDTCREFAFAV